MPKPITDSPALVSYVDMNKLLNSRALVIWDAMANVWRHCNNIPNVTWVLSGMDKLSWRHILYVQKLKQNV